MSAAEQAPAVLWRFAPWPDPAVEAVGFALDDPYVERFWLPVLGPTATWLLRVLRRPLEECDAVALVDPAMLGWQLGMGPSHERKLRSTVGRLEKFRVADRVGVDAWLVRTRLAPLSGQQVARMPASARAAERRYRNQRGAR